MYTFRKDYGFTLIEVMIAIVVLVIGILAIYSMQVQSIKVNYMSSRMTTASTLNSSMAERFLGMKFSDNTLKDNDGDGTGQDGDHDGIDDDGGDFGLDDATNATADGTSTTSDNNYTIYWNVAVDIPMPNLKTVRIIIRDNKNVLRQPIVFTYIKDDLI